MDLQQVPFDLHKLVRETIKGLRLRLRKSGWRWTHSIAARVPDRVMGDPARLRQADQSAGERYQIH